MAEWYHQRARTHLLKFGAARFVVWLSARLVLEVDVIRTILCHIRRSVGVVSSDDCSGNGIASRGVESTIDGDSDSCCGFCLSESLMETTMSRPQCACWLRTGALERWLECRILAVAFAPFESVRVCFILSLFASLGCVILKHLFMSTLVSFKSLQVLTSWLLSTLPSLLSQRPSLHAAISKLSSSASASSAAQNAMPTDHSIRAAHCLYHLSALYALPLSNLHSYFELHSSRDATTATRTDVPSSISRSSSLIAFRETFIDAIANVSFDSSLSTDETPVRSATSASDSSTTWVRHAAATLANVRLIWSSAMSSDDAAVEVVIHCSNA